MLKLQIQKKTVKMLVKNSIKTFIDEIQKKMGYIHSFEQKSRKIFSENSLSKTFSLNIALLSSREFIPNNQLL